MTGLLKDVLVIESSMLLNGASTTMMLADLGARVIKIESPNGGDYIRASDTEHLHRQVNRRKRSISLDLKQAEGKEVLRRLMRKADVFVTNAIADRNAALSLDYQSLRAIKSDLVYCQNTGFGATGPYRDIPTHGQMMDAMAGAMPVRVDDEGFVQPQAELFRRTGSLASGGEGTAAGAVYSAFHIAAGLHHRDMTGEGCYIDISSAAAVLASAWVAASALLNVPGRGDWWRNPANTTSVARYQAYQTSDGLYLLFCPEERKFWHLFCDLVERPDLKEQEKGIELRRKVQDIMASRTLAQWLEFAVEHRLPIGPINDGIEQVRRDPQIASRELFFDTTTADGRPFVVLRQPGLVNGVPSDGTGNAPGLGEQTREILTEIGYSDGEVNQLNERGVTAPRKPAHDHISRALFGESKRQ